MFAPQAPPRCRDLAFWSDASFTSYFFLQNFHYRSSDTPIMPSDSGTVVAVKSVFLRSQIRILSQPLQLTDKSREGSNIPKTVLQDVMNEGWSSTLIFVAMES